MNVRQRLLVLGVLDMGIVCLAVLLYHLLRYELQIPDETAAALPSLLLWEAGVTWLAFSVFRLYHRVWQYASSAELTALVAAASVAQTLVYLLHPASPMLYVFVLLATLLGVGGSRLSWRLFRAAFLQPNGWKKEHQRTSNALIIGAGAAGVLVVKELLRSLHSPLRPVAFLDDAPAKQGLSLCGLPIIGTREKLAAAVASYDIDTIIIAIPSLPRRETAQLIALCKETTASIKLLPSVADVISGKVEIGPIRDVQVEDLLGREPVDVDLGEIATYVSGRTVLVTGAGGSIGSELCRQLARFAPERLLLLGHGENSIFEIEGELRRTYPELMCEPLIADIQDLKRLRAIFGEHCPAVVFHAAAHKHVPLMEKNPAEAIKNNILGTWNVARCADEHGVARFVMISSDKAVNPTSVMGVSKRIAELLVQAIDARSVTRFAAVRFGNVLGSRGSVVPLFQRQIREQGEVTVTHPDMVRYFMTIPEAVQLVIQAGAFAAGGEVFILDMDKPVRIVDLARDLIRLSGYTPDEDVKIRFTGIRPGEKLYEELLTDEEGMTATTHNRIFIGKPSGLTYEQLLPQLHQLAAMVSSDELYTPVQLRAALRVIVPTYLPTSGSEAVVAVAAERLEVPADVRVPTPPQPELVLRV